MFRPLFGFHDPDSDLRNRNNRYPSLRISYFAPMVLIPETTSNRRNSNHASVPWTDCSLSRRTCSYVSYPHVCRRINGHRRNEIISELLHFPVSTFSNWHKHQCLSAVSITCITIRVVTTLTQRPPIGVTLGVYEHA